MNQNLFLVVSVGSDPDIYTGDSGDRVCMFVCANTGREVVFPFC